MSARRSRRALTALAATVLIGLFAGCENAVDQVDVRDSIQAWEAAQED
ncbi:hypothetical protein HJD18_00870 [Thermoleophilia bacterium SCSIO 60948]|nr:hypothetical protein HJD18_00870 [Thermoleophilia bacterium SCSIO 60948]